MNEWIYSFIITIDFAKSKAWMETEDNDLLIFEILIAEKYSFQKTSQEMQEET